MTFNCTYPGRILAIAPSTRGFGFAVIEGMDTLVDWGVKSVQGDKNTQSLMKVEQLIVHYRPQALILQDMFAKDSKRSARIRKLGKLIVDSASARKIKVILFSKATMQQGLFRDGRGTKHALAELIAKRFAEELGPLLPAKRRPWMSEDSRMDIFEATALALVFRLQKTKRTAE